jgi:Protein of unknown function (DUF3311)
MSSSTRWTIVVVLLIPAVVLPLLVGVYARTDPELWGFPFFYWYQFLWVFLASGFTWAAFRVLANARRGDRR